LAIQPPSPPQVETAFRFEKDGKGKWRVAEIRTGDRRWEDVDSLMKALNAERLPALGLSLR
jgi:hypothetical protein